MTGSHTQSSDIIPTYCYVSTWQVMPRPAGETGRYLLKISNPCNRISLALAIVHCYHIYVKAKHHKILAAIFTDPVNGNMEWSKIESLLSAIGCRTIEGAGSSITFEKNGIRAYFHRPHPAKEALRYRIKTAREFLMKLGETP